VRRHGSRGSAKGAALTDKSTLRAALMARRKAAHAAHPEAGAALAAAFPAGLIPAPGAVVAGYQAFRGEIDPGPLMQRLAALGCALALPRTPAKRPAVAGEGALSFHAWRIGALLVRSEWGVMEPPPEAPIVRPDLVLVPLVGFDRRGGRLGYGQGHYDRALAALKAQGAVRLVGLAFAEQEVAALPQEPFDQRLDWIITPEGAYRAQEI
jgi:5-formyltetrahydrofolate cyclo-ligase